MINQINTIGHKVSAVAGAALHSRDDKAARLRVLATGTALAAVFLVSTSNLAMASDTLAGYAGDVSEKTNVVVDIVGYVCYLGGTILSALGIVDLKKHVENPGNNPLKNGLAKLGFGGILLGLPFVSGLMLDTMDGGSQATYDGFDRGSMQIK